MTSEAINLVVTVIEKENKYLLVQEAQEKCFGKWGLPGGHLDTNETLFEGAKREVKEETGCDAELTGVCQIGNRVYEECTYIAIVFTAKLLNEEISFDKSEILDVKWFSYEEILAMRSEIRNEPMVIGAIENARNGIVAPLGIVKQYPKKSLACRKLV